MDLWALISSVVFTGFRFLRHLEKKEGKTPLTLTRQAKFISRGHILTQVDGWVNTYRNKVSAALFIGWKWLPCIYCVPFHYPPLQELICLTATKAGKVSAGNCHLVMPPYWQVFCINVHKTVLTLVILLVPIEGFLLVTLIFSVRMWFFSSSSDSTDHSLWDA